MADAYEVWLSQVQAALRSINMAMDDWQKVWRFEFRKQFDSRRERGRRRDAGQQVLVAAAAHA